MHTKSWRVLLGPLLVAVAASVLLTESAQAQQTGLFPLHPIKRKRVPCSQEDPVYRIYKDQYFGYHPTLWRPFPKGWGAPSPEAPDARASFKEIPLEPPTDWGYDDEEPGDEGAEPGPGRADDARPNLPTPPTEDERSPFEMDDNPAPAPRLETPPRQQPAPRDQPPLPEDDEDRSPFDAPTPRAGASARPVPPELSAPSIPATSRYGRDTEIDPNDVGGPLLAMPDTSIDDGYQAPALGGPASHDHDHRHGSGAGQQAPRRGRLASMMDGLGWNWRR